MKVRVRMMTEEIELKTSLVVRAEDAQSMILPIAHSYAAFPLQKVLVIPVGVDCYSVRAFS